MRCSQCVTFFEHFELKKEKKRNADYLCIIRYWHFCFFGDVELEGRFRYRRRLSSRREEERYCFVVLQSQTHAAELSEVAADGLLVYVGFMPAVFHCLLQNQ